MFDFIKKFFLKKRRLDLSDVMPGDDITIEWSKIKGGIGELKCLNNDPTTRTIFLECTWGNYKEAGCNEKEHLVLSYKDDRLKNFYLLNSFKYRQPDGSKQSDKDLDFFQRELNKAIENEEYERAEEIKKKIELIKKGKK